MDVSIKAVVQGFEDAKSKIEGLNDAIAKTKDVATDAAQAAGDGGGGNGPGFSSALDALSGAGQAAAIVVGGALVTAAGAAAMKIKEAVLETISLGDHLYNLSQTTGISVEKLGGLKLAAEMSGTSLDGLAAGITQFNRHLDDAQKGTGAAAEAFRRLGIDIQGASSDEVWTQFINKLAAMENGSEKVAIGSELMGRSFRDLIPLINEGAAGLEKIQAEAEKAGIVLSGSTAKAANELNSNLAVLGAYAKGFWIEIAGPIVEALAKITQAMRDARNEGAGLVGTLWAGVKRAAGDVLFGTPQSALDANKAKEVTLIAQISAAEEKKNTPGFQSNIVFDQNLAASYSALEDVYAARTGLENAVAVQDPNFFNDGTKPTMPAPPRAVKPGATTSAGREQSMESLFAADERFTKDREKVGTVDIGYVNEFYAAWAIQADGNEQLKARILAKASDYLAGNLRDDNAEIERAEKRDEATLAMYDRAQKQFYSEDMKALREAQAAEKYKAQQELQDINHTVFLTRDDHIAAVQALADKYREEKIVGETAYESIQKAMGNLKTDEQVFTAELAKMFALDIPQAVLATVGSIQNDLGTAIYGFFTGAKSLGDSISGFFKSVTDDIVKMFANLAAKKLMSMIFSSDLGQEIMSWLGVSASTVAKLTGSGGATGAVGTASTAVSGGSLASRAYDWLTGGPATTGAYSGSGALGEASGADIVGYVPPAGAATTATTATTAVESTTAATGVAAAIPTAETATGVWGVGTGVEAGGAAMSGMATAGVVGFVGAIALGVLDVMKTAGVRDPDADQIIAAEKAVFLAKNPWATEEDWAMWPDQAAFYRHSMPEIEAAVPAWTSREAYMAAIANQVPVDQGGYATGTDMIVTRPTVFTAGEVGAERVRVEPLSGASRARGGITINGPAMFDEYTFRRFRRMITQGA